MVGRNFAKLEVKVVKLSLRYNFVLEFRKVVSFLHRGRRQTADRFRKNGLKSVVLAQKFNGKYETEKARRIFLGTLGTHLVLRFGFSIRFSGLFTKCSK